MQIENAEQAYKDKMNASDESERLLKAKIATLEEANRVSVQ